MNEKEQRKYTFSGKDICCIANIPSSLVRMRLPCVTEDPLLPDKFLLAVSDDVLVLGDLLNLGEMFSMLLQFHLQLFSLFHRPLNLGSRVDLSVPVAFSVLGVVCEGQYLGICIRRSRPAER